MATSLLDQQRGYAVLSGATDVFGASSVGSLVSLSVGQLYTVGGTSYTRADGSPSELIVAGQNGGGQGIIQESVRVADWAPATSYPVGALVVYGSPPVVYKAIAQSTAGSPPPGAAWAAVATTDIQVAPSGNPTQRTVLPPSGPMRLEFLDQNKPGGAGPCMILTGSTADATGVPSLAVAGSVSAASETISGTLTAGSVQIDGDGYTPAAGRGLITWNALPANSGRTEMTNFWGGAADAGFLWSAGADNSAAGALQTLATLDKQAGAAGTLAVAGATGLVSAANLQGALVPSSLAPVAVALAAEPNPYPAASVVNLGLVLPALGANGHLPARIRVNAAFHAAWGYANPSVQTVSFPLTCINGSKAGAIAGSIMFCGGLNQASGNSMDATPVYSTFDLINGVHYTDADAGITLNLNAPAGFSTGITGATQQTWKPLSGNAPAGIVGLANTADTTAIAYWT